MALTYGSVSGGNISLGNKRQVIGTISLDSSYTTNGYAFSLSKIGLTATGSALGTHTHTIGAAAGAEASNGTDLSAITGVRFSTIGY